MLQFLGPENDRMCQFLGPESVVMDERNYIVQAKPVSVCYVQTLSDNQWSINQRQKTLTTEIEIK
jgi:hypothetical protein